jgi:hypothetical protein
MTVRCSKCGEELMGAVNRCWKCGQTFAQRPEIDGRPPVRGEALPAEAPPLTAVVLDHASAGAPATRAAIAATGLALPQSAPARAATHSTERLSFPSTSDFIDAKRTSLTAMGGTIGSLVLGLFALVLALFRFEAALIALLGLVLGIWGLYSPKRALALVAMLLCCLAIGLGSYTGANQLYVYYKNRQPILDEYNPASLEP